MQRKHMIIAGVASAVGVAILIAACSGRGGDAGPQYGQAAPQYQQAAQQAAQQMVGAAPGQPIIVNNAPAQSSNDGMLTGGLIGYMLGRSSGPGYDGGYSHSSHTRIVEKHYIEKQATPPAPAPTVAPKPVYRAYSPPPVAAAPKPVYRSYSPSYTSSSRSYSSSSSRSSFSYSGRRR